jgi:hypothetical protein
MFCQHCGTSNPDGSSFCGACGKNIAWTDPPLPSASARQADPPRTTVSEAEERLVRAILAPETKKDKWKLPNWLGVAAGIVVILMVLPHKDGSSVCDAAHTQVAQQVPFAVEILAARHPLTVGLVRAATKESGFVDKLAGAYVQSEMIPQQDPGVGSCYIAYYSGMLPKDRVRASIADWLEAKANLK